jgi:poly(3-hydroxybutyrate) depolymerase
MYIKKYFLKSLFFFLFFIPTSIYAIDINGSVMSGGVPRTFVLHAPGLTVANSLPVMIVMHGDGGTGIGIKSYTGFDAVADANNFMAVYPDAVAGSWKRALGETEDVQFISNLIDYLCQTYFINKQKVYASGHSAGGFMTYNLATNLANKIAAFAPVAGNMYGIAGYNYNAYFGTSSFIKVPIYHIHGDADGVVTYPDPDFTPVAWDEWPFFQFTYGTYGSCNVNTYTSTNTSTIVTGVQQISFCNGTAGNKPVYLIRILGGGHGWPSVAGYNPALSIWNFCNAFSLNLTPACLQSLPIQLITLQGNLTNDNAVSLKWNTTNSYSSTTLEYSEDKISFFSANNTNLYNTNSITIPINFNNLNQKYFRLKCMSNTGQIFYSNVIVLKNKTLYKLSVTISNSIIKVHTSLPYGKIIVSNTQGQIVSKKEINSIVNTIEITNLVSGIYMVKWQFNNETQYTRFIK